MYFKFISCKGRNVHYSEPDAGESYFKAVLSNTKKKTKVVSKRKFFQSKKYATTNSPEADGNMNI